MLPKLSILITLLLTVGCNKDVFDYNKLEAFDDLHNSISRYSASIESRNVNWDSLAIEYRANISEGTTEEQYFVIISELLQEFRDPHIWLLAPFKSMYTIEHLKYEKNYNETTINAYLSDLEIHSPKIRSAFINDSIGYLFCSDFRGEEEFNNNVYISVLNKFADTKGLIIDLRINNGGIVYNAQNLLNKLSLERTL